MFAAVRAFPDQIQISRVKHQLAGIDAGIKDQQHFVVPTLNFFLLPQLELNTGIGFGLTRASNGVFLKAIVGWDFDVGRLLQ